MAGREALQALRGEFAARAAQSATERYLREAQYLNDPQLGVRYEQLVVCHRRLTRELKEANAGGLSRVPTHQLQLIQDMEIQKNAFERERFNRNASRQTAAVYA